MLQAKQPKGVGRVWWPKRVG